MDGLMWSVYCLFVCLVGWLVGWLLVGWLVDCLVSVFVSRYLYVINAVIVLPIPCDLLPVLLNFN
jgi:hypothetical protein